MKTTLFRRILVPHDFSTQAMKALKVAVDLASAHRGTVTVLHVVPPPTSVAELAWSEPEGVLTTLRTRLQADVESAVPRAKIRIRYAVVVAQPVTAILAAARRADSIVMATLGMTGIAHWLLGSVAEKVVRLSNVPVLTIRVAPGKARSRPAATGRKQR